MKFKHTEKHAIGGGIGMIYIENFSIPKGKINYDVLAKFYSSIRKRQKENGCPDVVGIFQQENNGIQGSFFLNYGAKEAANVRLYMSRFDDTFDLLTCQIYEVIDAFLQDDEDGYDWYVNYIQQKNASYAVCDKRIERFLKKIGLKKDDDHKKENYHPLLRPR